eukprot:TRINITY_DN3729_c0_g5_i1.p1 TRINITY_DN3729_c0_g5~~TRINITY_DN3729_c0_g5_i1.p1  ORF type:complete len:803 (+),score=232.99 TRINITY_DN3729_c0_g5_i1:279-2411(+)
MLAAPRARERLHPAEGWVDSGVLCYTPELARRVAELLHARCAIPDCGWSKADAGVKALRKHLREEHDGSQLCTVCVQGRPHVFLHEHTVYRSVEALNKHWGADSVYEADTGFVGHPLCRFCQTRQYDNEALYEHMLEVHEACNICDRVEADTTRAVFYKDHGSLSEHCRRYHWFCEPCAAKKSKAGAGAVPRGTDGWAFREEGALAAHNNRHHSRRAKYSRPSGVPPRNASGERSIFTVVFDHGEGRRLDEVQLDEFRNPRADAERQRPHPPVDMRPPSPPPPPSPPSPPQLPMPTPPPKRGGYRATASAATEPEPDPTTQPVVFEDSASGSIISFAAPRHGHGIICHNSGRWIGTMIDQVLYEDGLLRFPQIGKRIRAPSSESAREILSGLASLADAAGVRHNIPEMREAEAEAEEQAEAEPEALREEAEAELETLRCIVGEGGVERKDGWWRVRVAASVEDRDASILFRFKFTPEYPDQQAKLDISVDVHSGAAASLPVLCYNLLQRLNTEVVDSWTPGDADLVTSCWQWLSENFGDVLAEALAPQLRAAAARAAASAAAAAEQEEVVWQDLERFQHVVINEGEMRTEQKSRFLAHHAAISTVEEAQYVVTALRMSRKIGGATHPCIYAYRVLDGGKLREECDDDGESGASQWILQMLRRSNVVGHIAVVTRWYGGVKLGPLRYTVIRDVAKMLLQQQEVISEPKHKK